MFDCKQDIGLLHSSLLSVAYSNSGNLFDYANVKDAVHIVYNSVKMIIHHSLSRIQNEVEKTQAQLRCNERLHAALFFTTLRSHGIKSEAADEFYESILYNWPSVSLMFYVELSFRCDWSEYFVMCALQLPSETLFNVLKMILEIPFESNVEYYSQHLILQTLIFKLLEMPYDKEINCPFNFDFEAALSINDKSLNELSEKSCEAIKVSKESDKNSTEMIKNGEEVIYKCSDVSDKGNTVVSESGEISVKENNSQSVSKTVELDDGDDTEEENDYLTGSSYRIPMDDDNDDETIQTEDENLTYFKEMSNSICNSIALKMKKGNEINSFNILLHALKTVIKLLKDSLKKDCKNILLFENYIKLIKDYIATDDNKETLQAECQKYPVIFSRHAYATVSWNISINYLIFLLGHYVEEIFPNLQDCESFDDGEFFYKNIISVVESLDCFNSPFLKSNEHITLLCKIIEFEFQGTPRAIKLFLTDPSILTGNKVLDLLEKNCHLINLTQSYSIIVDQIMSSKSPELKQGLLKILYKCLQMNDLDQYNTVIGYVLSNYGFTEEFELSSYNEKLSEFARETPTLEEALKKIPPLMVQNPNMTLKYLINEALVQGPEGKIFIQLLKYFQNACFYMKNFSPVSILHEILNDYLNKFHLEEYEAKNMVMLYRFLMEVHLEKPILLPCIFFNECIIPKLNIEYDKIELLLECAYVLLPALLLDDTFLQNSVLLYNFIAQLGILVDHVIIKGNGEIKSFILPLLKELENHQEKNKQINDIDKIKLWSVFKDLNEMTCVYFEEFLPKNIVFASQAAIWVQCCKNENSSNFQANFSVENLTYVSLLNILVKVLPHLTKEEWQYCPNLAKICCSNKKLMNEIIISNNPFELSGSELDIYAIISIFVSSCYFILNKDADGSSYMSSCFSNFLKTVIIQEETTHFYMLLSIFLDICHLASCISPHLICIYKAVLLEMKKEICSCSAECDQTYCHELLNHAIMCLPK